ncbi:MAG: type IV pilin protein [Aquabacterium sp.]|uniref:type IV pilin protein n=1 Tax=Aquabacterium sp. TaxID=1872578 RepID=UPI0025BDF44E|nr:type IV pilin protein [Aquabacterium sp.]MBI3381243.1 type IV pilin protein [Aquabacterium sp.]
MNKAVPTCPSRGFTLVELMIVIAIIGILGALAYPSYTNNVARGRRADAQKALLEASQFMQRYYVANNSYADSNGQPPTLPGTLTTTRQSSGGIVYDVAVTAANQQGYTIKATPSSTGLMARDECGTFVLESSGRRSLESSNKTAGECWR